MDLDNFISDSLFQIRYFRFVVLGDVKSHLDFFYFFLRRDGRCLVPGNMQVILFAVSCVLPACGYCCLWSW